VPLRFQEHDFEICALAFSKDERLLATVGNERSVWCSTACVSVVCSCGQRAAVCSLQRACLCFTAIQQQLLPFLVSTGYLALQQSGHAAAIIDAGATVCRDRRLFVLDNATGKIVSNTTLLEPKVGMHNTAQNMIQGLYSRCSTWIYHKAFECRSDVQELPSANTVHHVAPTVGCTDLTSCC
jgi:hypothetical protein